MSRLTRPAAARRPEEAARPANPRGGVAVTTTVLTLAAMERLVPSTRYRHLGDVIRLIAGSILLLVSLVASKAVHRWLLGPDAAVGGITFGAASSVVTGIVQVACVAAAALVPCVAATLPAGWSVHDNADIASGHATFWLDSDGASGQAFAITLSATCDLSGTTQVPSDQPGTRRFDRPLSGHPRFAELRYYTFPGGCVSYQFNSADSGSRLLANQASGAVGFMPRAALVNRVQNTEGLALCGRGAACPG